MSEAEIYCSAYPPCECREFDNANAVTISGFRHCGACGHTENNHRRKNARRRQTKRRGKV